MGDLKGLSNDELEAKIKERKQELKTIIDFVKDIVPKMGREIERYEGGCHAKVRWELKNFGGFHFFYSTGLTIMGGDIIQILDIDPPSICSSHICLSIYWQSDNDLPTVESYDNSYPWQKKLMDVIRNKEALISSIYKEAEVEKQRQTATQKEAARRAELLKMAERLKL